MLDEFELFGCKDMANKFFSSNSLSLKY